MRLIEALESLKRPTPAEAPVFRVFLATGFTPLHLQTFLAAHLRNLIPENRIEVKSGLFGDLAGNIERFETNAADTLAVVIEWQDLDARLGTRNLGGWRAQDLSDIVNSIERAFARLEQTIKEVAGHIVVCVCLPTLPLPPLFTTATHQSSNPELQVRSLASTFAARISQEPLVRVLSSQRLDERSPLSGRLDLRADAITGFPYQLEHASDIAALLAALIQNPVPKKGLITDLDDTLWAGILGEVGVEGISWDLEKHTHMHGLYQQFLGSLASAGVLIGAASKNDPDLVRRAFEKEDLILNEEQVFPIEAHWSPKSGSVRGILKTWNIGPEAVVFVDDSPIEIAEVRALFPEIEGMVFTGKDEQSVWNLLKRLRDLFGKSAVSDEDLLRLQSIRTAAAFQTSTNSNGENHEAADDFLRNSGARIQISFEKQSQDTRAFELINKTNQFNLNGKRLTDAAWIAYLNDPHSFLMAVNYEDKYGALGKIAVLLGKNRRNELQIDFWVMSCRAFSRRIEHQCLRQLFGRFDAQEICFDYQPTARNSPLQVFFTTLRGQAPAHDLRLSREAFFEKSPPLFHEVSVREAVNA